MAVPQLCFTLLSYTTTKCMAAHLLWRIRHPAIDFSSYVFGTAHLRIRRLLDLAAMALPYLLECRRFAAEITLDAAASTTPPVLTGQEQVRFANRFTEKNWSKMRHLLLRSTGLDIDQWQGVPPIFIQQMIDERLLMPDAAHTVDSWLWQRARQAGMETAGLERIEEQMATLGKISEQDQADMLKTLIRRLPRHRKHLCQAVDRYLEQDIRGLYQLSRRGLGKYRRPFLFDRNIVMAEGIARMSREVPTFAAVGAAHLWGGKGVLRLVKHRGYRLEPVALDAEG